MDNVGRMGASSSSVNHLPASALAVPREWLLGVRCAATRLALLRLQLRLCPLTQGVSGVFPPKSTWPPQATSASPATALIPVHCVDRQ